MSASPGDITPGSEFFEVGFFDEMALDPGEPPKVIVQRFRALDDPDGDWPVGLDTWNDEPAGGMRWLVWHYNNEEMSPLSECFVDRDEALAAGRAQAAERKCGFIDETCDE